MERRETIDRRGVHMFVADERREGPYDRRGAEDKRLEREREKEKIERIRAFKERDNVPPPAQPLMTKQRLVILAAAGVAIAIVLWLLP